MTKQIFPVFIQVAKQNAQVYFTVLLPKDTVYITKIQTSVRFTDNVNTNIGISGTIQLQATGESNICYYTFIKTDATPVAQQVLGFNGGTALTGSGLTTPIVDWMRMPYVANEKQTEEKLRLVGSDMLYGCYKDETGAYNAQDISYMVSLFLHLELKN